MERFHSDQSPITSQAVVNYSSINYGGFLFRSPNSPPPSPSLSPPPSIASLSHLFLGPRFSRQPQSQPPLLPLPRSATLPMQSKRVQAAIPRRNDGKRKGKMCGRARKEMSPTPVKVKEERKHGVAGKEMEASVFSLSPPPSCLPFPTFSLMRTKISVVDS